MSDGTPIPVTITADVRAYLVGMAEAHATIKRHRN